MRSPSEPLDRLFESAVERVLGDAERATVLFSGGVDSAVVAGAASARVPTCARTIGRAGSEDLRVAEEAAALLGLPWQAVVVRDADVARALDRHGLAGRSEPMRSVLVSFALALETPADGVVLVGQGADELFGGYAHYRGLSEEEFRRRQREDWQRLLREDWPATVVLGRSLGQSLAAPFLDPEFSAVALPLGTAGPAEGEPTKPAIREWAVSRGIPSSIARRPKRAIQYGSGVAPMVRTLARR